MLAAEVGNGAAESSVNRVKIELFHTFVCIFSVYFGTDIISTSWQNKSIQVFTYFHIKHRMTEIVTVVFAWPPHGVNTVYI